MPRSSPQWTRERDMQARFDAVGTASDTGACRLPPGPAVADERRTNTYAFAFFAALGWYGWCGCRECGCAGGKRCVRRFLSHLPPTFAHLRCGLRLLRRRGLRKTERVRRLSVGTRARRDSIAATPLLPIHLLRLGGGLLDRNGHLRGSAGSAGMAACGPPQHDRQKQQHAARPARKRRTRCPRRQPHALRAASATSTPTLSSSSSTVRRRRS